MKLTKRDRKFWDEIDNTTEKEQKDYFYYLFDRTYTEKFIRLKMVGGISKEIEEDYKIFNEKAIDLWEQLGLHFSVLHLYAALPGNKWCEICIKEVENKKM